ncbi:arylsulfatase [Streptomyces sp. NPDC058001]|uniref:arylsulfatase n=1 Tax=Streptomyces sp. NPDC058001 TaxID=3346300 RepID=UPI0036E536D9
MTTGAAAPLALLHTSPLHIPVFDAVRDEDHPGLVLRHYVDPDLLARAGRDGPESVADDVRRAVGRAVADGAGAVLCTCSTIGGVAEAPGPVDGVPVLRVDRPMAAAAVAAGPRVVVVATVASTVAPTLELIEEEARRAGRPVATRVLLLDAAWELFARGDSEGYVDAVAEGVDGVADADVIVLAQVSTAPAEHRAATRTRILTSPRLGLAEAATVLHRGHDGHRG